MTRNGRSALTSRNCRQRKLFFTVASVKGKSAIRSSVIISGGRVARSILGPRVFVHSWAQIEDSIVFENVEIGRSARIRRAIIDKDVKIPPGEVIGYNLEKVVSVLRSPRMAWW